MEKLQVGIDLGTSNTVCCIFQNSLEVIQFRGKDLLPSVIYYSAGKVVVGQQARRRMATHSEKVISSAKTYLGDRDKTWTIEDRTFTPCEVSEEVLREVYKTIKKSHSCDEIEAVITVPAYFTSRQYEETETAAKNAGFQVIQLLPEPVAAAIAYGIDEQKKQKIFVIDLGGGTFDVSVLKVNDNVFTTIGVDGDRKLGGDDFNQAIVELCKKELKEKYEIDLSTEEESTLGKEEYGQAIQKLQVEAEKAKIELSVVESTSIIIPSLLQKDEQTIDFGMEITREQFKGASIGLMERIRTITTRCLEDSKETIEDIDKVILVGGSAHIPFVSDMVKEIFKKNPYADKDLSKLVATGAAIVATGDKALIRDKKIEFTAILSHSLGTGIVDDKMSIILPKNMAYPCKQSMYYTTVYDNQESMEITVYEGEDTENVHNNLLYDEFELCGIERNKKGIPEIEITFEFDKNRILHVTAKDMKTNAMIAQQVKIK